MMRRLLLCLVMMAISLLANGQSIDSAKEAYTRFTTLAAGGGDKGALYNALNKCYEEHIALAASVRTGTEEYQMVRDHLRTIWPYFQNGAAYFSQNGMNSNAVIFARAYVDIPMMELFRGEYFEKTDYYPTMVYFAASGLYNSRNYDASIKYLQEYIKTRENKHRRDVYLYMSQAYTEMQRHSEALDVLASASEEYPSDYNLLSRAINICLDTKDNLSIQTYLAKALAVKPNDVTLLNIQGKSLEEVGRYEEAVEVFRKLIQLKPSSMEVSRHLAVNYYNAGAMIINTGVSADGGNSRKQPNNSLKQAKDYFEKAIPYLKNIVENEPMASQFVAALAVAYNYTGNTKEFEIANSKLVSLGYERVTTTEMPSVINLNGTAASASSAQNLPPRQQDVSPTLPVTSDEIPTFPEYAQEYIENIISKWQEKDPYETVIEYQTRVNITTRDAKVHELSKEAEKSYISRYAGNLRVSDFSLKPYDAENEVFLAESRYGEVIIPVPRSNNEARMFENNWSGVSLVQPEFCIDGDKLAIKSLTFRTPTGKSYHYDNADALNYTVAHVNVNFGDIDYSVLTAHDNTQRNKVNKNTVSVGTSDVDVNIPKTSYKNDNTFAVIIANENYELVENVSMAVNDGKTFGKYCEQTLGLPTSNVRLYENATYGSMLRAMRDISGIAEAYKGDLNVIFYYAGHGIPDESTKDAFLLPVDADGRQTEACYSLAKLYNELGSLEANSVVVFLDACFSGAQRDGGMLASARGVAIKSKSEQPHGNMITFSAASDDETAFPYKEKGHGLFTYYLLKKIQETKGDVTMQELGDYVIEQVKRQSIVVNKKPQTPVLTPSASMQDGWKKYKFVRK